MDGAFTLVELLVVMAILGLLAMIAIPHLARVREKAVRKQGMENLASIALLMERRFAEGNFSFTSGAGSCPGTQTFTDGSTIGDLGTSIRGSYYRYTIEVADLDGDRLCETYTITATGIAAPVSGQTLALNHTGVKSGPWQ
ncbi:MAG: prepilin-type N-terminal cleavage/methylation domain-containing protein [bacterium]